MTFDAKREISSFNILSGMRPSDDLAWGVLSTSIGAVLVGASHDGVAAVHFGGRFRESVACVGLDDQLARG